MNPDQTDAKKAVKSRAILLQYMLSKSISRCYRTTKAMTGGNGLDLYF